MKRDPLPFADYQLGLQAHRMGSRFQPSASAEWKAGWLRGQELAMNAREKAELRRHEKRCPWERDDDA